MQNLSFFQAFPIITNQLIDTIEMMWPIEDDPNFSVSHIITLYQEAVNKVQILIPQIN